MRATMVTLKYTGMHLSNDVSEHVSYDVHRATGAQWSDSSVRRQVQGAVAILHGAVRVAVFAEFEHG
jgi:hypothetical protein